jgi:hypothetical protein
VRLQPRASKNEVLGWQDGALRVRLTAPPVEGAANKALIDFISETLGVKRAEVHLVSGQKSRDKVLEIEGLSGEDLLRRTGAA